jgi:uncharacterized protein involved in exopolysaccharide biosynthesis
MIAKDNLKDPRIWWQIIRRRWYILSISFFGAIGVGLFIALTTPPEFEATAKLLILDTDLLSGSSLRFVPNSPSQNAIEYFRRLITNDQFVLDLADSVALRHNEAIIKQTKILASEHPEIPRKEIENQVVVSYLQKKFSVKLRSYNLIDLNARARTSLEAFYLCSALTNLAIRESQKEQLRSVEEISSLNTQLLQTYKSRLDQAQQQLNQFNADPSSQEVDNFPLTPEKVNEIQAMQLSSKIELKAKQEQIDDLKGVMQKIPIPLKIEVMQMSNDLGGKMLQRTENVCQLFKKFSWRDIEIIQLNEEIGQLKKTLSDKIQLAAHATQGLSSQDAEKFIKFENLSIEMELLQKAIDTFNEIMASYSESNKQHPTREILKQKLEREVKANQEIYDLLSQQEKGTQIRETAESKELQLGYKLLSPPQRPLDRIKPNRRRIMIIALFLGLCLGGGMVMGLESLDLTFKTVEEVTLVLGLPVLGTVPKIKKNEKRKRRAYDKETII